MEIKSFFELGGLFTRHSSVYGSLNLLGRMFTAPLINGATSNRCPGWSEMCRMMEREDLPNTSENTSSGFRLETVKQF